MANKRDIKRTVGLRATSGTRTLRFGMVAVTIGTSPVADTTARVQGSYRAPDTLEPVQQQYVTGDGKVVKPVTAYTASDGTTVALTDSQKPAKDSEGDVRLVATPDAIPAELLAGSTLTWPSTTADDPAYVLLAAWLKSTGRTLVGEYIDRGTTKVMALRWSDLFECIVASTVVYHERVRWSNVETIREGLERIDAPEPAMLDMVTHLFDSLPGEFDLAAVTDTYATALQEAIDLAAAGTPAQPHDYPGVKRADPADLMAALQASIDAKASERATAAA